MMLDLIEMTQVSDEKLKSFIQMLMQAIQRYK